MTSFSHLPSVFVFLKFLEHDIEQLDMTPDIVHFAVIIQPTFVLI